MGYLPMLCIAIVLGAGIANNELDLWNAAKVGNLADVNNALARGANPDAKNGGSTPIYWASAHGYLDVVTTLISHNASVNIPAKYGWTPLMMATVQGHTSVVEALINAQANINLADNTGETALHRAALWHKTNIARLLLKQGADKRKKDNKGRTPSDVARAYGHQKLANIIKSFTAASVNTTSATTSLTTTPTPTNQPIITTTHATYTLLDTVTITSQPSTTMTNALIVTATSTVPIVLHVNIIIGCVALIITAMILYLVIWFYKSHHCKSFNAQDDQPSYMHFKISDDEPTIHTQKDWMSQGVINEGLTEAQKY